MQQPTKNHLRMKEILQFINQPSRPLHMSRDSLLPVFNGFL